MDPFSHDIFNSEFNIGHKFKRKKLKYSLTTINKYTMQNYLIFELEGNYIIIGFDFKYEKIRGVSYKELEEVLYLLKENLNFQIQYKLSIIEKKWKNKDDFLQIDNLKILKDKSNWLIKMESKVYIENQKLDFRSINLIFDSIGLNYGEVNFRGFIDEKFKDLRLFNDLNIEIKNDEDEYKLSGAIFEAMEYDGNYKMIIKALIHELSYYNVGFHKSSNLNPISYFSSILKNNTNEIVLNTDINVYSPYLVLIPFHNININEIKIRIENIIFYDADYLLSENQYISDFIDGNMSQKPSIFAQIFVDGESTFEAFTKARNRIETVMNMINIITKSDTVFSMYNISTEINRWNRSLILQNPLIGNYYFAENIISNEKVAESIDLDELNISINLENSINKEDKLYQNLENLLFKYNNEYDCLNESIFNAIKWLNRSWKSNSIEDKIIYTNIALEFITNDVKVENYIAKEFVDTFKREVKPFLNNLEIFPEEESKKINEKVFSSLNSTPLKTKVIKLICDLNINISDIYMKNLWDVRKYRNDIVHGRSIKKFDNTKIVRSNLILGEIILNKLLKEGVKN
ncbi:hypothetical protein [Staphylococcus xylosus]|uniref:hypothetical protein n=1 Tax=Staphylococcus xylosus TaxID=1288 RepID=UPI003F5545E9